MRKSSLQKACEYCGKIYSYPPYRTKMTRFCSRRCTSLSHPENTRAANAACRGKLSHSFAQIIIECLECGKYLNISPSRIGRTKFCSIACRAAFLKVSQNKYLFVRIGQKKRLLHRLIMERKLRRKLSNKEIVHHKNGDCSDNRLSNLKLMKHSEHSLLHSTAPDTKVIGKAKPRR